MAQRKQYDNSYAELINTIYSQVEDAGNQDARVFSLPGYEPQPEQHGFFDNIVGGAGGLLRDMGGFAQVLGADTLGKGLEDYGSGVYEANASRRSKPFSLTELVDPSSEFYHVTVPQSLAPLALVAGAAFAPEILAGGAAAGGTGLLASAGGRALVSAATGGLSASALSSGSTFEQARDRYAEQMYYPDAVNKAKETAQKDFFGQLIPNAAMSALGVRVPLSEMSLVPKMATEAAIGGLGTVSSDVMSKKAQGLAYDPTSPESMEQLALGVLGGGAVGVLGHAAKKPPTATVSDDVTVTNPSVEGIVTRQVPNDAVISEMTSQEVVTAFKKLTTTLNADEVKEKVDWDSLRGATKYPDRVNIMRQALLDNADRIDLPDRAYRSVVHKQDMPDVVKAQAEQFDSLMNNQPIPKPDETNARNAPIRAMETPIEEIPFGERADLPNALITELQKPKLPPNTSTMVSNQVEANPLTDRAVLERNLQSQPITEGYSARGASKGHELIGEPYGKQHVMINKVIPETGRVTPDKALVPLASNERGLSTVPGEKVNIKPIPQEPPKPTVAREPVAPVKEVVKAPELTHNVKGNRIAVVNEAGKEIASASVVREGVRYQDGLTPDVREKAREQIRAAKEEVKKTPSGKQFLDIETETSKGEVVQKSIRQDVLERSTYERDGKLFDNDTNNEVRVLGESKPKTEPWQMKQLDYVNKVDPHWEQADRPFDTGGFKQHKASVEKALAEGKPVPTEVLKDYPSLTKPTTQKKGNNKGKLQSGIDPTGGRWDDKTVGDLLKPLVGKTQEAVPHLVSLGKQVFHEGHTNIKAFAGRMKEYLGDLWDSFRQHIGSVYKQVKELLSDQSGKARVGMFVPKSEEVPPVRPTNKKEIPVVERDQRGLIKKLEDAGELTTQKRPQPEPKGVVGKFAAEAKPAAKKALVGFRQSGKEIQETLSPASSSDASRTTAGIMRHKLAETAHRYEITNEELNKARDFFSKRSNKENLDFIDRMENGSSQLTLEEHSVAKILRKALDDRRELIRALGTGKLDKFYENYFPHIWKDVTQATDAVIQALAHKPFEGGKSFLKHRELMTTKEGIEKGLEPVSYNPVELALLKMHEMDKYLMAHQVLNEMKTEGLLQAIPFGDTRPPGYAKIDDKISLVTVRDSKTGKPIKAVYYAPVDAARIINNYLSPGLRGKAAFRGYLQLANTMNQFQLGFSAFHLGFTSMDAVVSKFALGVMRMAKGDFGKGLHEMVASPLAFYTNYKQGAKLYKEYLRPGASPELKQVVDALVAGGGRIKMDEFYRVNYEVGKRMKQAFREGNLIGGVLKVPFALAEASSGWIMEHVVPRQKLGVFMDIARMELEKNPNMTPKEMREVMGKAWDSVDNRMGQLVYDNLFWDKTVKDLAMASVRSVGWNLGTFRELGGGLIDFAKGAKNPKNAEFTYRMSYVIALPIITGIIGAITNYLSTGEAPKDYRDYYFPRTGGLDANGNPSRMVLPSYMKDVFHFAERPGKTIINKLHPALSMAAEMMQNKDFYGKEIRHTDDPAFKQALQVAQHALKGFQPFSVRGAQQNAELGEKSIAKKVLPFIGITPAPSDVNKTEAEKLISEIMEKKRPVGAKTQEEFDRMKMKSKLRNELISSPQQAKQDIADALKQGIISKKDVDTLMKQKDFSPVERNLQSLNLEEALKVYSVSNPEEKKQMDKAIRKKIKNFMDNATDSQKEKLKPKIDHFLKRGA